MRSFRRKHARFKLRAEDRERLGPELADRRVRPLALEKLRDALNRGLLTRHAILSAQRVTENCVIAWRLYILFALCQARSERVWWVLSSAAYPGGRSERGEPRCVPCTATSHHLLTPTIQGGLPSTRHESERAS